jgi:hypothetical protein
MKGLIRALETKNAVNAEQKSEQPAEGELVDYASVFVKTLANQPLSKQEQIFISTLKPHTPAPILLELPQKYSLFGMVFKKCS